MRSRSAAVPQRGLVYIDRGRGVCIDASFLPLALPVRSLASQSCFLVAAGFVFLRLAGCWLCC